MKLNELFKIIAACYPEGHSESTYLIEDIHLFTMHKPYVAQKICEAVARLLAA